MASPPVATASDGTQYEGHILRLGVDLGTGHLNIDGQHVQGNHDCDAFPLRLKDSHAKPDIKQIAIHTDKKVIYGLKDVTEAIKDDPELRDKDIQRFKLALHPEFADIEEVKHVKFILGSERDRGALQIFNSDLFRTITEDVRDLFTKFHHASMDAAYWESIPIEFQISVPAMWDDDARGVIRNAAKHGGAWRVELRLEPLCIATPQMVHMVKNRNIKTGQCLLLLDCGEGTFDIATVQLIGEPSDARDGQLMKLRQIGSCSGNGAGSHKVNTAAEKWVLDNACTEIMSHGGLDETCMKLGMSKRQFLRAFSDEIDKVKVDIDMQGIFDVRIYGRVGDDTPGSLYQLTISIPRTLLMEWYTTWTELAKGLLEDHLSAHSEEDSKKLAWALFTGGGAGSPQFCKQMETVLSKYHIPVGIAQSCISACSSGALMQHLFQQDLLPPKANFYISQTEYYRADKHKDAKKNKSLVHQSKYDNTQQVVYERLCLVMQSSVKSGPSGLATFVSEGYIPQIFYVEAGEKFARIHVDLFWSLTKIGPNQPLNYAQGKRRGDVRSYPLMFVDFDDFKKNGFPVVQDEEENNGVPHFVVNGFVRMEGTSESLIVTVYLMKQHYEFTQNALGGRPFADDDVLKQHTDEVWHKNCSHFVSSSSGVERAPPSVSRALRHQRVAVTGLGERKSMRIANVEDEMDVSA